MLSTHSQAAQGRLYKAVYVLLSTLPLDFPPRRAPHA